MTAALRTAPLAAALALAAFGCQQKSARSTDPHAGHDHRPTPEGRIEVDQSAVLPVDVKAGVQREYPGSAVQSVQKRTEDDRVVRYEVQLKTKDGKNVTRVFDADGKPSSGSAGPAK
jgi:hypothetical protein